MTKQKGKLFKFEKNDLEWINLLILEWVEENEGKNQSDLIVELLQDYKQKKDTRDSSEERMKKVQENVEKVAKPMKGALETANEKLNKAMGKFEEKSDSLNLDEKYNRMNESLSKSFSNTSKKINQLLTKSSDKIKEHKKNKKPEE